MQTVYFDYAAATPLDTRVMQRMEPFWTEQFYNPSTHYQQGQNVRESMDVAKNEIAHILGVKSSEIIATSGGTEANNLAIRGVMEAHPKAKILVSAIEHDSVKQPAKLYQPETISVGPNGILNLEDLKKKLDETVVLVSVMHANNEIGTVQPLRKVAQILEEERTRRKQKGVKLPLYLHSDACQSANYLDVHAHTLGVDLMTLNGGKIYGPKQSGCLFVASHVVMNPQILGGGQQRNLRSGTENPAQIVGLAEALKITAELRDEEVKRLQELQNYMFKKVETEFPLVQINGSKKYRLPNNINLAIDGHSNERLLIQLEDQGILAAAGSACKVSSGEVSSVLQAIGLTSDEANSSIRLTFGRSTSKQEVDIFLTTLNELLA